MWPMHLLNKWRLLTFTEYKSMLRSLPWSMNDSHRTAVLPRWPFPTFSSYALYLEMTSSTVGLFRTLSSKARLQDDARFKITAGSSISACSSSVNFCVSIRRRSMASQTVLRQKRLLAYALPLMAPFRHPVITSCASISISWYPVPSILWPHSMLMYFMPVWNWSISTMWFLYCSCHFHINGNVFMQTPRS